MCVAEGAIRSGKTIDHCIIAASFLETCPDKIHLASGSSMPNAKLNIGDCNGFGLEHLFRGRCRWGKYKDNEALYISTQTGEKIVIFAGGGKADSFKKILGNSYGLWIATEINEHYDCDDSRTSFIKVAFGRQAAAERPFTLWDLNPSSPNHRIYTDYIDAYQKEFVGGYLYEHFTMNDNLSVTPERRAELESQYIPGTFWYERDINGKRRNAEGIIYSLFADDNERYIIDDVQKYLRETRQSIKAVLLGADFGHNKSANSFKAVGITNNYREVIILGEKHITKPINPSQLEKLFVEFAMNITREYGGGYGYGDNAEGMLVRGIAHALQKAGVRVAFDNCIKHEITDRIVLTNMLFAQDRIKIARQCEHMIDAFNNAVWDEKAASDTRLDDGSTDIDSLDAFEYSICYHMENLEKAGHIWKTQ